DKTSGMRDGEVMLRFTNGHHFFRHTNGLTALVRCNLATAEISSITFFGGTGECGDMPGFHDADGGVKPEEWHSYFETLFTFFGIPFAIALANEKKTGVDTAAALKRVYA